jgi:hypothetical protein
VTTQPAVASPGDVRTVPTEAWRRHDSSCFWDVDECRWQCATYPLLGYAVERRTAIGRPVAHAGPRHGDE